MRAWLFIVMHGAAFNCAFNLLRPAQQQTACMQWVALRTCRHVCRNIAGPLVTLSMQVPGILMCTAEYNQQNKLVAWRSAHVHCDSVRLMCTWR